MVWLFGPCLWLQLSLKLYDLSKEKQALMDIQTGKITIPLQI